jgi:putative membrane protein
LALIAGGLAVAQFVKVKLEVAPFVAAIALILFGAMMSVSSYDQWQRNERALRLSQPVVPSALPRFLMNGVVGFAAAAAVLAVGRLVV